MAEEPEDVVAVAVRKRGQIRGLVGGGGYCAPEGGWGAVTVISIAAARRESARRAAITAAASHAGTPHEVHALWLASGLPADLGPQVGSSARPLTRDVRCFGAEGPQGTPAF